MCLLLPASLQYIVKRQFAPFVVQAYEANGQLEVFVVSDMPYNTTAHITISLMLLAPDTCSTDSSSSRTGGSSSLAAGMIRGATAAQADRPTDASMPVADSSSSSSRNRIMSTDHSSSGGSSSADTLDSAGPVAWAASKTVHVSANNARVVFNSSVTDMVKLAPECTYRSCYVAVESRAVAVGAAAAAGTAELVSRSESFLVGYKDLELQQPVIRTTDFQQVSSNWSRPPNTHLLLARSMVA